MKKAGKKELREHNKKLIINCLRKEMSRSDLAKETGLANSAIASLVNELLLENLVYEKEIASSSGGRRPIILALNPDAAYALILQLEKTQVTAAVLDLNLTVKHRVIRKIKYPDQQTVDKTVCEIISGCLEGDMEWKNRLAGICITVPGLVDSSANRILYSTALNLRDYDITRSLRGITDVGIAVIKSTDAALLGENMVFRFDLEKSYLYIKVDTGVGLSFYTQGGIVRLRNSGMEVGHLKINVQDTKTCNCGKRGCVEAYLSEIAALEALNDKRSAAGIPLLEEIDLPLKYIVEQANAGDRLCSQVLEEQCRYLGVVIANAVNLYPSDMVILGGHLSGMNDYFAKIVKQSFMENVLVLFCDVPIVFSTLSDETELMGIASKIFDDEIFSNASSRLHYAFQ